MTNTTTETITVTVTSNDERNTFRVTDLDREFYPRHWFGEIMRRAIDAHLASLPPLDPEWGTRETAGDYAAVFVPRHKNDKYPWRICNPLGDVDNYARWKWTQIKKEAQK